MMLDARETKMNEAPWALPLQAKAGTRQGNEHNKEPFRNGESCRHRTMMQGYLRQGSNIRAEFCRV